MRLLTLAGALAVLVLAPSAGAQEPPSLVRAIDGPTPMEPIATGFDAWVGYQHLWRDSRGPFFGDQERWIAWNMPGRYNGSTLLDTQTMTLRDVPDCRLGYGHGGLFVADCPDRAPRASLVEAATGEVRAAPSAQEGDTFYWIGEHWMAGDDLHACENAGKCDINAVFVNWRTGERRVNPRCRVRCWTSDPEAAFSLDRPELRPRRHRYDPRRVQGDLSIERAFRRPLVLRQRGRPPVLLSRCAGRWNLDNCHDTLSARRVTWAPVNDDPRAPIATVNGYVADTGRRFRWTFRFHSDPRFGCPRAYGTYLRTFHTRHAVIAVAVDRFAPSPSGSACQRYPESFTLYAARWPD